MALLPLPAPWIRQRLFHMVQPSSIGEIPSAMLDSPDNPNGGSLMGAL